MENYVIKYLSQIFDFSRNFLYISSLKRQAIATALQSNGFHIQYAMLAILFGGIALFFQMNHFIDGLHIQRAIGAALLQVVLGSILGVISLLITGKIIGVHIQLVLAWRYSTILSATGITINGIFMLSQLGIIQLFHIFWDTFEHTELSHRYYDLVNAALIILLTVYFLTFAFMSIRAFCEVCHIPPIWRYFGVWIAISFAITILAIPLLFVSYSILGIPIELWVSILEDFNQGACCTD